MVVLKNYNLAISANYKAQLWGKTAVPEGPQGDGKDPKW